jgi:hypothetical protein
MTLQELHEWAAVEPMDRNVHLKIERGEQSCWVYSFRLQEGQFIEEVSEIDLEGQQREKDRKRYAELRARFEPELLNTAVAINNAYKEGMKNAR